MYNYKFGLNGYEGIEFITTLQHDKQYTDEQFKDIICKAIRKVTRKRKIDIIRFADKIIDKLISDFGFSYAPTQASFWRMEDTMIGDLLNDKD